MVIKEVVVLEEAVDDLEAGKVFYDQQKSGVGSYFWDSLIADIESLYIFGGIHVRDYGLYRLLSKRFPYAIYYEIKNNIAYIIAILPYAETLHGLKKTSGKENSKYESGIIQRLICWCL